MSDESTTDTDGTEPEVTDTTDEQTGDAARTFTQAELDDIVNKRIGRERTKSEREFKEWLEEQSLTAEQQAQAEAQRAAAERDEARREALTVKVETRAERAALAAGVKPERVDRFLRLVDLSNLDELVADGKPDTDAIAAAIDATLADVPEFKGAGTTPAGGTQNASTSGVDMAGAGGTPKQWTRADIAKLSAEEYEQHKDEIFAQLGAGSISK